MHAVLLTNYSMPDICSCLLYIHCLNINYSLDLIQTKREKKSASQHRSRGIGISIPGWHNPALVLYLGPIVQYTEPYMLLIKHAIEGDASVGFLIVIYCYEGRDIIYGACK